MIEYPIPPPYRKRTTASQNGHCLWCGEKIRPSSELKDQRYHSMYFCPSNEKDCNSRYFSKFDWDNIRWRVFIRDKFICQSCGFFPLEEKLSEKAAYLECDHILAVGLGGCWWDEDNLQTLCIECHKQKTRVDLRKIGVIREFSFITSQRQRKLSEFIDIPEVKKKSIVEVTEELVALLKENEIDCEIIIGDE